jgi:hypothetical protein
MWWDVHEGGVVHRAIGVTHGDGECSTWNRGRVRGVWPDRGPRHGHALKAESPHATAWIWHRLEWGPLIRPAGHAASTPTHEGTQPAAGSTAASGTHRDAGLGDSARGLSPVQTSG